MELLGKINAYIPLDAVFWAGVGLVGVVLILAITGCIMRKRLVPHWLIWLYFTFAAIVVWAQDGVTLVNILAYLEYPILVVLVCYLLRLLFYRSPRYTFVKAEVYERYVAKHGAAATQKTVKTTTVATKTVVAEAEPQTSNNTQTVTLPTVEPIPDKTYEPVREPDVITTPLAENLPDVKTTRTATTMRPVGTTTTTTTATNSVRPMSTTTATTTSTVRPASTSSSSFAATYQPRVVTTTTVTQKPTVTTTTTTRTNTTTSTVNSNTLNSTVNRNATTANATTANTTSSNTQSTQDIMAAIARLRASMNNKK